MPSAPVSTPAAALGGRGWAAPSRPPETAGRGGPPRVVPARGGAASGKPRLALAGRPWPLLAKVAQRFFPATEVLFSPTGGLSSPRAVLEAVTTETFPFLWAGKQTQTGARTHATWAPQPMAASRALWPRPQRREAAGSEGVNPGDVRAWDCRGGEM